MIVSMVGKGIGIFRKQQYQNIRRQTGKGHCRSIIFGVVLSCGFGSFLISRKAIILSVPQTFVSTVSFLTWRSETLQLEVAPITCFASAQDRLPLKLDFKVVDSFWHRFIPKLEKKEKMPKLFLLMFTVLPCVY